MCRAVTMMRRSSFNSGMRKGMKEGMEKGREEGREEGMYLAVCNALRNNMSHKDIQLFTGFSLEKIASIAQSLGTAKA